MLRIMPKPDKPETAWRPDSDRPICRLADLKDGTARGFTLHSETGDRLELIIWHQGDTLAGFINQCPHLGLPLETFPDRFLSADGTHLICSAHGAQFDTSGKCFAGPCRGDALSPVTLSVERAASDAASDDASGDGRATDKMIVLKAAPRHS